ncbi:hypothetical protein CBR_g37606 [Chara braunii]|uniref:Uncharacterized protein n=1 Tax=Chara braunii TaxID=69332 RepID=A0A388LN79_CHABU|nr:hypothetical protein CBR_g37606 [Chara braunii]|eukprot:GBG83806.1 hypothetical protein CBR_g37606 [Chara braunii]
MRRGRRGTRPPQRPLGASGGYERHGSHHREGTLVYDDGDVELFLDDFRGYAEHMGWTMTQTIERLRGAGRFVEPIARIRREARTWQEVEIRMQELQPSSVGPDGRPIRLEIGNAKDFIPAFEQFMAHLREAFRRPEPPHPRVERRQRSKRQRDPGLKETMSLRGGRKALARREEESIPEAEERGAYSECGIGPELEAHLDVSQWRVPRAGEGHDEPTGDMPQEEVHEIGQEARQNAERGAMGEVIEVHEDTPPQAHAAELGPESVPEIVCEEEARQEEILSPPPEAILSPGVRVEMEREQTDWRREAVSTIDRYLATHA